MRLQAAHRLPVKRRKAWETRPRILPLCPHRSLLISQTGVLSPPWCTRHAASGWDALLVCKRFSCSSSSVPRKRKEGRWETPTMNPCCRGRPAPHAAFPGLVLLPTPAALLRGSPEIPSTRHNRKAQPAGPMSPQNRHFLLPGLRLPGQGQLGSSQSRGSGPASPRSIPFLRSFLSFGLYPGQTLKGSDFRGAAVRPGGRS